MHYIRFVVSVLLILCTLGFPVWGKLSESSELDKEVERQVAQTQAKAQNTTKGKAARPAAKQHTAGLTARQWEIKRALDKVRVKTNDPKISDHIMSLEDFKDNNQLINQYAQKRAEIYNTFLQERDDIAITQLGEMQAANIFTVKYERPNYTQETKNMPFIYLTDSSGHSRQSIVNEVQEVMRSVRAANPQANILLALEFADMQHLDVPILFAGKTNEEMDLSGPYEKLAPQADQLGMDILALGDAGARRGSEVMVYKIGSKLVYVPVPYESMERKKRDEIFGFVNASTLGMKLRNEQWVSYIRAVRPFYDIVIVYAGSGHLGNNELPDWDVTRQLGEKHVIFNFYTLERNNKAENFQAQTFQTLCEDNACVQIPPRKEVIKWEWDGTQISYQKTDFQALKNYVSGLSLEKQKPFTEIKDKLNQAGFKDVESEAEFDVYLPDVTQAAGK